MRVEEELFTENSKMSKTPGSYSGQAVIIFTRLRHPVVIRGRHFSGAWRFFEEIQCLSLEVLVYTQRLKQQCSVSNSYCNTMFTDIYKVKSLKVSINETHVAKQ